MPICGFMGEANKECFISRSGWKVNELDLGFRGHVSAWILVGFWLN
jgi:hypothetical protein